MSEISRFRRSMSCDHDRHQPGALLGLEVGPRRHLDRGSKRGERILELVRHVGGEALDGVDALPQRVGHRAQGVVQVADLVAALAEVGDLRPALARQANLVGGARQPHDRLGDGAGEIERQQHGDAERRHRDGQHVVAHLAQRGGDRAVVARQHQRAQHLLVALHRHGGAQQQPAVGHDAHRRGVEAAQRARRLGEVAQRGRGRSTYSGKRSERESWRRDPVADPVGPALRRRSRPAPRAAAAA